MKRTTNASPPRSGSAMSSKLRRRGAVGALLASAVAFLLALPAFASAGPLGEPTFYDEGLRPAAEIDYTTEGPDGNVWFVDHTSLSSDVSGLGKITPAGAITEYICGETLSGCNPEARLTGITAGPEGDTHLWFTDRGKHGDPSSPPSIGRIDSASPGTVEEFSIEAEGGNAESTPQGIVAGPEGKLWFTDTGATRAIGVFDPSSPEGERVEEFSEAAGLPKSSRPRGIVAGSDDALWFTDTGGWPSTIGRIDPNTHMVEQFPINYQSVPGGEASFSGKSGIVAGPDGDIWFTETKEGARGICKIEVADPHEIKCFSEGLKTPKAETGSKPYTLTVAEGELWFTDHSALDEKQSFTFGTPEVHWTEGEKFELCNEDKSSCATGTYKTNSGENSAQVLNALESIYGAGNVVATTSTELNVTVRFAGELAMTSIGQTSCKRLSGAIPSCSGSTVTDGGPDAIDRINKYDEIVRYPIDGLDGVRPITYVSGGDLWFAATSNGVNSIGKFGIEISEIPLTLNINEGEGTVVSNPAGITCSGPKGEECTSEFEEGAEVTLTASPAAGYVFYAWQSCPSPTGRQCKVTMSEAKEVGVKFKQAYKLSVSKASGSETGIFKVLPSPGVVCPAKCQSSSYTFVKGTEVTVTRYEPAAIHHFVEFSGGTGSAEACDGQTVECTIKLEADSSLEGLFEKNAKAMLSLEKQGGGQAKITSTATRSTASTPAGKHRRPFTPNQRRRKSRSARRSARAPARSNGAARRVATPAPANPPPTAAAKSR